MTTDTALALLRDAAGNLYMAYNAFTRNDAIAWEPLKETADRITALLDSGIKDAGDDVAIPKSWIDETDPECPVTVVGVHSYNELQSAYKRVKMEKDLHYMKAEALHERAEKAESERDEFRRDAEDKDEVLQRIKQWCEAYPIDIFPEPDFKKAHEVLTANGMTLDAISASSMRHVVTQISKMIAAIDSARNK